jgi:molecular chaperone GrpE
MNMSSKKTHHPGDEPEPEAPLRDVGESGSAPVEAEVQPAKSAPLVSVEEAEALKKQLEEAQAQAAEFKDGWQRSVAEFANYRKRLERESGEVYQNAVANIIKRDLPVLDDLERALAARPAGLPWADGVELIYRKLQSILEAEGIQPIAAEGQPFDPNFHEAIAQEPSPYHESGTVIAVVRNGYMLGERVIRPAMVRVAQ